MHLQTHTSCIIKYTSQAIIVLIGRLQRIVSYFNMQIDNVNFITYVNIYPPKCGVYIKTII